MAEKYEVLSKRGAYFKYNDENVGQGKKNCKKTLMERGDLREKIKQEVLAKIKEESDRRTKVRVQVQQED